MGFECFRRRGNVYSFEYSPEMVTVRDSSKVEERFVEQSGVNVSFREREREKPCLRV